jgi:hypothetical protein
METRLPRKPKETGATGGGIAADPALLLEEDPRLAKALGDAMSPEELKIWVGMPEPRRVKALQRIKALDRYVLKSEITAALAAEQAGVKLGRFYQMARAWSDKRSLGSLGAYASATKPRVGLKPHQNAALYAAVKRVVTAKANQGDSIAALARKLGEASNLPSEEVPAQNTLRVFIEREKRRLRDASLAGTEIQFDLSATSLRRSDGLYHVVFLVLDGGTGLILGHSVGLSEESALGYGAAAKDSLVRIPAVVGVRNIWADEMKRSQLVPGSDTHRIGAITSQIKIHLGGVAPQLTDEDAQGRYIRHHLGLKLGSVRLNPARTIAAAPAEGAVKGAVIDAVDAFSRIELAVAEHNAALLATLALDGEPDPPGELLHLLEMMAEG